MLETPGHRLVAALCKSITVFGPEKESLKCRSPSHVLLRSRAMFPDGTGGWRLPLHPFSGVAFMSATDVKNSSRGQIRSDMRRRRRSLSTVQRAAAARAMLAHLQSVLRLRRGLRIAVYLPVRGEMDTRALIELARARGCRVYVPVVRGKRKVLCFTALEPPLRDNRFGIPEPLFNPRRCIDARHLDVALLPLLAFGAHGERLGSGAGYYDQTFAFLRRRGVWRKPRLIGLAYSWQACATLESEAWDVPLSAVATDRFALRFTRA